MELNISKDLNELNTTVADWMVTSINKVLATHEHFTLALTGGNTPKNLYKLLASDAYVNKIDWSRAIIFWGDERFVPLADDKNNAKMAFDILLDNVPVRKENVHIMFTENITAEDSAKAYEEILYKYFPVTTEKPNTFDIVLLGMGGDAHTLSLFPGRTEVINEKEKWCTSFWLEDQNMYRITLTAPVVNKARCVAFLVSGKDKAEALQHVIGSEKDIIKYPSQIIQPESGELHWFVDQAAMRQ